MNIFSAGSLIKTEDCEFLTLKTEFDTVGVKSENIAYIQATKGCCKIYTESGGVPNSIFSNLTHILDALPHYFLQVHPSFIVNTCLIQTVQKRKVIVQDMHIPIGENYKTSILTYLT